MVKQVKRSVIPIYLIGITWLGYALLFSLRTPGQYLLCAVLSAAAFVAGKYFFPDKVVEVPAPPEKPKTTGNPEIDALIKEKDRALSELFHVIVAELVRFDIIFHKTLTEVTSPKSNESTNSTTPAYLFEFYHRRGEFVKASRR